MSTDLSSTGIHHVSLNVRDTETARRFYVDVLGFTERPDRPDFPFAGAWLDLGTAGQQLHLLEVADFDPPRGQHFALAVDDLDAAIAQITSHGIEVSEPSTIDGICRQAFTKDPTGNLIELNQPIAGS